MIADWPYAHMADPQQLWVIFRNWVSWYMLE